MLSKKAPALAGLQRRRLLWQRSKEWVRCQTEVQKHLDPPLACYVITAIEDIRGMNA